MGTRLQKYVFSVTIVALATVVALAYWRPEVHSSMLPGAIAFAAMGFVAQALTYSMATGSVGSIGFLPFLTSIVLYPSWITVLMVAAAVLVGELKQKKPSIKRIFNVSQYVVAYGSACAVFLALGGVSIQADASFYPVPLIGAIGSFFLVNTWLVAIVIGLSSSRGALEVWRQNTSGTLIYDVVTVPVVYWCALLFTQLGWGGVAFVFIVMSGARQFYQQNRMLNIAYEETLELLVGAVELRDPYTSGHSQRVRKYSKIIASALGLPLKQIERIGVAALLHDVGKIDGIFVPILQKPGKLTPEERGIMELHPLKSAELVARASQLTDIIATVRHHHENWDGTGYPDRIAGKTIPLGSRIIMFADTIDAMTTDRPYRTALGESEVRAELIKYRGIQFDPNICDVLIDSVQFARIFDKSDSGQVQSLTQIFDRVRRRTRTPAVA
jgi:HD-GYP domain-containing protein (c-di-GMP phosphodiesterase class II)